jgi:diacylglycerol kinase family enzyme
MAIQSLAGKIHKNPYVEYHKSREIVINITEDNTHIHIDGEPDKGKNKMKYLIKPSCLNVVLPDF